MSNERPTSLINVAQTSAADISTGVNVPKIRIKQSTVATYGKLLPGEIGDIVIADSLVVGKDKKLAIQFLECKEVFFVNSDRYKFFAVVSAEEQQALFAWSMQSEVKSGKPGWDFTDIMKNKINEQFKNINVSDFKITNAVRMLVLPFIDSKPYSEACMVDFNSANASVAKQQILSYVNNRSNPQSFFSLTTEEKRTKEQGRVYYTYKASVIPLNNLSSEKYDVLSSAVNKTVSSEHTKELVNEYFAKRPKPLTEALKALEDKGDSTNGQPSIASSDKISDDDIPF